MCRQKDELYAQIHALEEKRDTLADDLRTAQLDAQQLVDQSTAELEENIANIENINVRVRANLDKAKAEDEAEHYAEQYAALTGQIETVRADRLALLNGAKLPLPGLSVEAGELIYDGKRWDCMSGSDQLIVATAIVRALNPRCGFVLLDKLEQMDTETLASFNAWLRAEGLQVIGTRVSTGDECSIIITDGYAEELTKPADKPKGGYWD